ncbi:MAG: type II toxin-antitoxin system Phd/YefM family antitoxin [Pseudomonadota bacterium]
MAKAWALQDAKNHFSEVVDRALQDGPQTVTRHGREAVVIVSAEEFKRLTQPEESLADFFRRSPLHGLELEIERQRDTGRRVDLG